MTDPIPTITRLREAARAVVNSTGQQTDGTWVIGWDGDGETLIGDLLDAVKATEDLTALLDGLEGKTEALRFYRDQWTFHAVGDEGDGVTDMGRLDGYEAAPTSALLKDGGDLARATLTALRAIPAPSQPTGWRDRPDPNVVTMARGLIEEGRGLDTEFTARGIIEAYEAGQP